MPDIFISYSRKDAAQAEQLAEMLSSAGLSCWIDREGIDVATSWSGEIVDAIDGCKAFVVLISPSSVESHNVIKEVSLAAEQHKKILPLDLEPVELPRDLKYHLAGIQRAPMTNIDAVIRALGKLGLEATGAPQAPKIVTERSGKKSVMILPFHDLSPTNDNEWFADGVVSELIQALSRIKSLQVKDAQTTKDFKRYAGTLPGYAREMGVRYFVEGDVRKFGDQIKINTRLLDIESGDYLWQDSLRGRMDDIFDIQERVAKEVLDGLHVILTTEEERGIEQRSTTNAEAYELWMKGQNYYARATRPDFESALLLFAEAVRSDPKFVEAHLAVADTILEIYENYVRETSMLEKANHEIEVAESIEGNTARVCEMRSKLLIRRGDPQGAISIAQQAIALDPRHASAYLQLCMAYRDLGQWKEASDAAREAATLRPDDRALQYNYIISLNESGSRDKIRQEAKDSIQLFERYLKLAPDDLHARTNYACILGYAGQTEKAYTEACTLQRAETMDGYALYNLACIFIDLGHLKEGMASLKRAVDKGLIYIEGFRRDPSLDPVRNMPQFHKLMAELEARSHA